jgi:hypothetical protein
VACDLAVDTVFFANSLQHCGWECRSRRTAGTGSGRAPAATNRTAIGQFSGCSQPAYGHRHLGPAAKDACRLPERDNNRVPQRSRFAAATQPDAPPWPRTSPRISVINAAARVRRPLGKPAKAHPSSRERGPEGYQASPQKNLPLHRQCRPRTPVAGPAGARRNSLFLRIGERGGLPQRIQDAGRQRPQRRAAKPQ